MRRSLPWLFSLLILILAGCSANPELPYVHLSDLDPTLAAGAQGISPRPVLRVGLSTALSPRETLLRYGPLLDYLSQRLGRHVELVLTRSHTEMLDQVRSGGVQVAFLSSYAYVRGREEFGLEALAVPLYQESPARRSLILARRYSGLEQFAHLKGHTFAYTDPLSASGRLFPETLVLGLHESVDRFFDRTIFTSTAEKAIRALDQGLVDGAAVDSVAYDLALREDPDLSRRLMVLTLSEELGAPPVVVHPRLGSELKRQIQEALLAITESEEGLLALDASHLDGFVALDPAWYEPVAAMATQLGVLR